jgi:photosystem II stability/assembly factor-like uncharacterized protein
MKNKVYEQTDRSHSMIKRQILLLVLFLWAINDQPIPSMETEPYTWNNVPIGGGGYVTGIVIHPTEPDLLYIRTDVGGAYRWDARHDRMIPLTDWIGYDESNLYGIDGFALAPSNPDIIYMVCGKYPWAEPHSVLKSTDRGETWHKTALQKKAGGNQGLRWAGECIAIDPANEEIVYCGTRFDGLWKTIDGGHTWARENAIPAGSKENGIRTIVIAPSTKNHPQTIYVGVYDVGVFRSTDNGTTWNFLNGSPSTPIRMAANQQGNIFVSSRNGVFAYTKPGWTDISPVPGVEYASIATDPHTPDRLLCAIRKNSHHNPIYLSEDRGKTWRNVLDHDERHFQVPWWPKRHFSASTACTIFDPHHRNRVWFVDWYGTWHTPDITARPCHWYTHEEGHEEMVVFGLISPTQGAPLLTALADNNGTRHTHFSTFPETRFEEPYVQSTTGLDFCEANPNIVVRVGSSNNGQEGVGAYSNDNGQHWEAFKSASFPMNGRIAISATNPRNIVVLPIGDSPKYSMNAGKTWHESSGAPKGGVGQFWHKANPFCSDRVHGSRFYYFEGGKLFRSDDGGKNWKHTATLPRDIPGFLTTLTTAPYMPGDVWISMGQNGLFRSSDAGETFSKVEDVTWSRLVAFGKPAKHTNTPTLFVYGTIQSTTGIFRSMDVGKTWVRINDDRHQIGNSPECMTGDRQVFGRVYIGTNGRGVFYGEKKEDE